MKKCKVISIIFLIIFSVSLATCLFTACDFIRYVEKAENQVVSDEVKVLQNEYVNKLYTVTSEIKYRENEQKLYEYAIQDAVNELYECSSEAELKQVYEKHLIVIGKIKTDKEYSDEEEANAISAYRVAILGQAEESYDKQKYTEGQITYFDTVFIAFSGNLFETADREVMNELLQKFYFDVHKEDEVLSLINYADISTYEDSQKNILIDTLNKCIEDIRSFDKQENIDKAKEAYKFEVYKRNTVKKVNNYVDLLLYRNEQAAEIKAILTEHLKLAEEAETIIEADNVFREYQIAVYDIPTEEMLYSEELSELKAELSSSLTDSYKLSFYREREGQIIQELLKTFQEILVTIKNKEDVLSQYIIVKNRLDSVKTAEQMASDDRISLINELYDKLLYNINNNVDVNHRDEFIERLESVYSLMCDRISLESIRKVYHEFARELGVAEVIREELQEYNNTVFYRENEQNQVNAIKEKYLSKITDDLNMDITKALLDEAKAAIDVVKTNDDLWNDSLTKFRDDLKALYGDGILEEPKSLTEASDYFELASIIDYYAFYQQSATNFVCDTFRVKLNFDHNDATWERNEVYWYCELLKSAVDIKTEFEPDSDYFVCTLIPYDFASISNERPALNRLKSAVEFDSDKSQMTERSDTFDDFAYYTYERTINVWNSQQLWYALEHEYVPICTPGSPAEIVMNRAKEILREIIMEGMTDEEKIFNIFRWIGENVQYDHLHENYNRSSDPDNLPSEVISAVRSHFIEGAICDGLAVCIGHAKVCLLMLRIEGIEALFNLARMPYVVGNTIATITYGFHGYVLIKLNEKWYRCDPQHNCVPNKEDVPSFASICMIDVNYSSLYEVAHCNLNWGTDLNFYQNLVYEGKKLLVHNKSELYAILDLYFDGYTQLTLSVFRSSDYLECKTDILNYGSDNQKNFSIGEMPVYKIPELVIYNQ